jgi:hypothetical protein
MNTSNLIFSVPIPQSPFRNPHLIKSILWNERFAKWKFPSSPSPNGGLTNHLLPPWRLCHNRKPWGEAVEFQSFRMRVFKIMGDRRLYKIECLHMLGTRESERLKVTALNLFHPTAPPPFQEVGFFILRHSLLRGRIKVGGKNFFTPSPSPLPLRERGNY